MKLPEIPPDACFGRPGLSHPVPSRRCHGCPPLGVIDQVFDRLNEGCVIGRIAQNAGDAITNRVGGDAGEATGNDGHTAGLCLKQGEHKGVFVCG